MNFCSDYLTAGEANTSNAFPLTPAPATISLPKTGELSNSRTRRDRLDVRDAADDLEVHEFATFQFKAPALRIGTTAPEYTLPIRGHVQIPPRMHHTCGEG